MNDDVRCDWCTRSIRWFEKDRALSFHVGPGEPSLFCCPECWDEYQRSLARAARDRVEAGKAKA